MKILNIIFYILSGLLFIVGAFDVASFAFIFMGLLFIIRGIIEIFRKNK